MPRHHSKNNLQSSPEAHSQEEAPVQFALDNFEHADHDQMKEYIGVQVARLEDVSEERFHDKNAWTAQEAFNGGKEYGDLLASIEERGQELTTDEKLSVLYMDSVAYKNEAHASVNETKVLARNRTKGNVALAFEKQFLHEATDKLAKNDRHAEFIANNVNKDGEPLAEDESKKIEKSIKVNKGVINDVLVAVDDLNKTSDRDVAKEFFNEVIARTAGNPQLSDEEFHATRVDVYKDMLRNVRVARAYAHLSTNKFYDSDKTSYEPKELVAGIKNLSERKGEAVKYTYVHKGEISTDSADEEEGNEGDDELARRVEDAALRAQAHARDAQKDSEDKDDPVQHHGAQPGSQSQGAHGAASASGAGTQSGAQPGPQGQGSQGRGNAAQPGAANGGNIGGRNTLPPHPERPSANEEAERKAARRELQQIRVQNAAAALQASSLSRSSHLFSAGEADMQAESLHTAFGKEVYELMQFDRPKILDDPTVTQKEKNAFISKYAFDEYHKVTMATVDSMGGEKDPKKRKRNARLLRLGGAGLGFLLGGPAGMVVGGSIGLGISKGLDSEMKNREKLKNAVQRFEAQAASDNYLNALDREGESYNEKDAFFAATANLMGTFEHGLVRGRRRNIGKAFLKGAAWTAGTMVVAHEAAAAMQYAGDQAYQAVSKASWSGTGASWDGGLNPNFNYTMHEKPVSMKVLSGLFGAANPVAGATVGAAILAGFGGIKAMQDGGPDAKKKKKSNDRTRANAA